jgi:hypothetical protein
MRTWPPATMYPATATRYLLVQLYQRGTKHVRVIGCRRPVRDLLQYSVKADRR